MKNLLLASTALVAFAGAASAEVAISGSGRMGVVYDQDGTFDTDGSPNQSERFSSRVRVAFTLTQETDSGVTFGGSVRADNASAGNNGSGGSVFLSGAFGKLSMGDVDGAAESAVGNLSGVGYEGLGDRNEAFYLQQGNSDLSSNEKQTAFATPAALYEYTTGPASFYLSLANPAGLDFKTTFFDTTDPTTGLPATTVTDLTIDQAFGLGAKYAVDNYTIGIGYESMDFSGVVTDDTTLVATDFSTNIDNIIIGGSGTFGGFTLKAQYGEGSGDYLDLTQYGASADYTWDAYTVTAFYRHVEVKDKGDNRTSEANPFGIGASYDLGGGASVAAGIVDPDVEGINFNWDLGVNFSF